MDSSRDKVIEVISKILELTSFAFTAEHKWVFMKVYLNSLDSSTFLYGEINNTTPRIPDSHENINPSQLADFLNRSYNNYSDNINLKYNFSLALKWYLDSLSLRYDVMKYISASISFESMLDSAVKDEGFLVDRDTFKQIRLKLEKVAENELREKILAEDLDSLLESIGNINRRS